MNDKEVLDHFRGIVESSPDLSIALAAIHTIMNVLKQYDGTTLQGLLKRLTSISDTLKTVDCSVASVSSGCELFRRFITLAKLEQAKDIQECKNIMLERGKLFLAKLSEAAPKITKLGAPFILDGMKVLTHSRSRIVLHTLIAASKANKRFHVYITQSSIDETGLAMERDLREAGIPCTLVLDSAVGYVMESVDLVMVGAEGVVESGGIINKIGTYTMALCAREMNKPFYVFAESFKFVRLYPLNQRDLPDHFKYGSDSTTKTALESTHPTVDYTPPNYITLLFTDLGILTPSASAIDGDEKSMLEISAPKNLSTPSMNSKFNSIAMLCKMSSKVFESDDSVSEGDFDDSFDGDGDDSFWSDGDDNKKQKDEPIQEEKKPVSKKLLALKHKLGLDQLKPIEEKANSLPKPKAVTTIASQLLKRTAEPEVVVYQDPRKLKKAKLSKNHPGNKSATNETPQEMSLEQAKHDVRKFGISGMGKANREEARTALAISLGAIPPKRKAINYKELQAQQKKVKEEEQRQKEMDEVFKSRVKTMTKSKKKKRDKNKVAGFDSQFGKFSGGVQKLSRSNIKSIQGKR